MSLYLTMHFAKQMPQGTAALIEAETKEQAVELLAAKCTEMGIAPVPAEFVFRAPVAPGTVVFFSHRGY